MNFHRIHRVAKLTGLSKDVIRVWERRYGLVQPSRSANRYRMYSDEDVALLRYVKNQLDTGQSIGDVVAVGREQLLSLANEAVFSPRSGEGGSSYQRLLHELNAALTPFNREVFEQRLNGAVAVIPFEEALLGILLPLQVMVGELWHSGQITVAIEHYVTTQVKQKIATALNQLPVHEAGPKVITACPPGEFHDIGAQAATYVCALRGCQTYALGANVPWEELERFSAEVRPSVVLLSVIASVEERDLPQWKNSLQRLAVPRRLVWLGGKGASELTDIADAARIEIFPDLSTLSARLSRHVKPAVRPR